MRCRGADTRGDSAPTESSAAKSPGTPDSSSPRASCSHRQRQVAELLTAGHPPGSAGHTDPEGELVRGHGCSSPLEVYGTHVHCTKTMPNALRSPGLQVSPPFAVSKTGAPRRGAPSSALPEAGTGAAPETSQRRPSSPPPLPGGRHWWPPGCLGGCLYGKDVTQRGPAWIRVTVTQAWPGRPAWRG